MTKEYRLYMIRAVFMLLIVGLISFAQHKFVPNRPAYYGNVISTSTSTVVPTRTLLPSEVTPTATLVPREVPVFHIQEFLPSVQNMVSDLAVAYANSCDALMAAKGFGANVSASSCRTAKLITTNRYVQYVLSSKVAVQAGLIPPTVKCEGKANFSLNVGILSVYMGEYAIEGPHDMCDKSSQIFTIRFYNGEWFEFFVNGSGYSSLTKVT